MNDAISRRQLLARSGRTAAAGAVWAAAGRRVWAQPGADGANDRIGLALIGCGQRGQELLGLALQRDDVAVVTVCDVDARRAALGADKAQQAGRPKPDTTGDFLRVLERKDVDGVIIATPDHWHAVQLLYACLADKDAYIEAPLTHNVLEGPGLIFAVRSRSRVVQVGLQQRAGAWYAEAVKQIQSGQLGRVAQTRSWTFMKASPIAQKPDAEPPADLDYDRWVGPAPMRPYNPNRVSSHFDNWWDYGGGMVTRWNVHLQDVVHWAMKTNAPKSVVAVGGGFGLNDGRETPDTLDVIFEYETGQQHLAGPFTHVYSLRLSNGHAAWGPPIPHHNGQSPLGPSLHYGTQFHGSDATLFIDRNRTAVFANEPAQPKTLDKPEAGEVSEMIDLLTRAHLDDFLSCMRSRFEPRAPIEAGHIAALPCHLANIAYRLGRKIYYDPNRNGCFMDSNHINPDHAADALLLRQYRAPYTPPPVGSDGAA